MLKGKTAVITGASRGIGRATALAMAQNGANVAVIYASNREPALALCREAEAFGVSARAYGCNVAVFDEAKAVCEAIVADFGTVDILVNNAGVTQDNLLLRMSEAEFDLVLDVNLKGAFHFTKHLARPLMKSGGGRIVNVSSVVGLTGNAGQVNYSASKAGLIGLTKSVAKEFAGKGLTCNAVAPGFVATDMTADLPECILDRVKTLVPLKRMAAPEEVANVILFLTSGSASYITGEVIRVDGGMCM